ncbi:MAG: hypothetical protein KKI09_00285 [Spirochaetes bacterium]|nr:hypothetical protein [Spirochaetota bacterium]MBU0953835.1 hypothetical protein [Spirochaetota bacterium]
MDDQTKIERYIEAAARANEPGGLDRHTLEDAVRGAGLDDDDLALIEKRRADLTIMGKGFATKALWKDAAESWQEVSDLAPWDPLPLLQLAESRIELASGGFPQNTPMSDQLSLAEASIRRAISLDPGQEKAYSLLARIESLRNPPPTSSYTSAPTKRRRHGFSRIVVILALGLLAAIAFAAFLVVMPVEYNETPPTIMQELPVEIPAPANQDQSAAPGGETYIPASDTDRRQAIRVSPRPGDYALSWSAIRSSLEAYPGSEPSWSYSLAAAASSTTSAFRELTVAAHFLDASGKILFTRRVEAVQDFEPVHYPGDHIKVALLVYEKGSPPEISEVRLEPVFADLVAASAAPPAPTGIPVSWLDESGQALARGLSLELRDLRQQSGFNQSYLYVDIAYYNTGQQSFKRLKFRCEWYDATGKLVSQESSWGFIEDDPLFEPGRRGVVGFILNAAEKTGSPAALRVIVEEASSL